MALEQHLAKTSQFSWSPDNALSDLFFKVSVLDKLPQKHLYIFKSSIFLLHLHQHCRFHIRQPNGDSFHMTASNRSSFSAIAARQNADTLRYWLLFNRSSAWWSFCASPSG